MIYLLFIVLIFFSAFFSASEIAFFSLTPAQVRLLKEKKEKNAGLVLFLKNRPLKTLITILLGNNIVNILSASLATYIAVNLFGSVGIGLATGTVTMVILILGEITPKSFAQKNNKKIAQLAAPFLYGCYVAMFPVVWFLRSFNFFIIHRIFKVKADEFVAEEEVKTLVRIGVESGKIHYREHEMIENIFNLNDVRAKEIMTPRYKMVVLKPTVPVEQIAHFIAQSGFSRFPVFDSDEADIIGYLHVNDLMRILNSDDRELPVQELARPISRVKEETKIDTILRLMLRQKEHVVLVERDPGEVVGLVTLEDVLEQVVGEISDEVDDQEGT